MHCSHFLLHHLNRSLRANIFQTSLGHTLDNVSHVFPRLQHDGLDIGKKILVSNHVV